MFLGAPILTLERTLLVRAMLCLFLLPFMVSSFWGADALREKSFVWAVVCGALGVGLGLLFLYGFYREQTASTRLFEDGIEQTRGSNTLELRFTDVTEIWLQVFRVYTGSLIGMAVGAAIDASAKRKGKPLDARGMNILVRILGSRGEKVVLTANDKDVVKAFEIASARVNPRLVEDAKRRIHNGETLAFGEVSLSVRGVARGNREVPFHEIERLWIEGGKLCLKKKGTWLDALLVPIQKIPNVFVLTELYISLAAGPVDRAGLQMGWSVVRGEFL